MSENENNLGEDLLQDADPDSFSCISETEDISGATSLGNDDDAAYLALCSEIREVLAELAQDKAMDAFRGEYEKLFNALEKSHCREKRLGTKCQELQSEIASQAAKVDAINDKSLEDKENIASLKKEIDKAWKIVDITQEREERARETIEALNTEIQNLSKTVEEKTLGAEDTNVNELRKLRDELIAQKDSLSNEVSKLKERVKQLTEENETLGIDKESLETSIHQLKDDLSSRTNEMNREIRRKERTEREVKTLKVDVERKRNEIKLVEETNNQMKEHISQFEKSLSDQKLINSEAEKSVESLKERLNTLQRSFETQSSTISQLEQENISKCGELSNKEEIINRMKSEKSVLGKNLEEFKKSKEANDKVIKEAQDEKNQLKEETKKAMTSINEIKRQLIVEKKRGEKLKSEITTKDLETKRNDEVLVRLKREIKNKIRELTDLKRQIAEMERISDKQNCFVMKVEEERDRQILESSSLTKKIESLMDNLRDSEGTSYNYQKRISSIESTLNQQQTIYQAVRNDRIALNRSLAESKDENSDLKTKLRVLNHQFDQLKEEITVKEKNLAKETHERIRISKAMNQMNIELNNKKITKQSNDELSVANKKYKMLEERYSQLEHTSKDESKKLERSITEKNMLDEQLGKRNEEVTTLKKKVGLQENILARGESMYREREEDIRILKGEIQRLYREAEYLNKGNAIVNELRKEVLQLQRDLLREKCKVKTLETELENPINVHRWRRLEGIDPPNLELVQKTHALQKKTNSEARTVDREGFDNQRKGTTISGCSNYNSKAARSGSDRRCSKSQVKSPKENRFCEAINDRAKYVHHQRRGA
ncbi:LOW QUALITY PROTEIN: cilia- and flagella-associated protein 58-like [Lepeophtheirus salmonis]|uniref:LOW QUALITY PROTEIN: cilia- and flagella-associated protein 58-like n=1 Tax=Lepeophtheirus salmonis TaxID=72036 RepID=UPI003AF3352B